MPDAGKPLAVNLAARTQSTPQSDTAPGIVDRDAKPLDAFTERTEDIELVLELLAIPSQGIPQDQVRGVHAAGGEAGELT